jgi:immune inhibitor A
MRKHRWIGRLGSVVVLVTLLARLAAVSSAGPAGPNVSIPRAAGRVTSIVPPPMAVVESLRRSGQPWPDLQQVKMSPNPVYPRPLQGTVNLLVVMVDFSDKPATVTNLTVFNNLVFAAPVSGRGSVRDYYADISRGTITLATVNLPSTTGWQRAPQTYAYYVNGQYGWGGYPRNAGRMVEQVAPLLDPLVNYANYDNDGDGWVDSLLVIHAGTGAEFSLSVNDVWSHASSITWMGGTAYASGDGVGVDRYVTVPEGLDYVTAGQVGPNNSDMTIGVICHEIAHGLFGLTDLYDLDGTSFGIGQWGLMSYGDWNGPAKWDPYRGLFVTNGSSPAWPMAWSRLLMGIDTANLLLTSQGGVTFPPVETTVNAIGRLKSTGLWAQEYFLLENRRQIVNEYDEFIPGNGLLIWHVDEAMWSIYGGPDNNNECTTIPHCWGPCMNSHYLVALEQADRQDDLELLVNTGDTGDPYPGVGNPVWRPYQTLNAHPESGTWFDTACQQNSCLDLINISKTANPPNIVLDINQAACRWDEADLGDAPASWNNYGNVAMTAYLATPSLPYVQAYFPTVFLGSNPPGPRHHFTWVDAWLGPSTTGEFNADLPPDIDGPTNLTPLNDIADMDSVVAARGYDDGLALPVPLSPCGLTSLQYTVTALFPVLYGPMPRFVNAWFDWNRDGDWADTVTCPGGMPVSEWAVQDQVLSLGQGTFPRSSPPFPASAVIAEGSPFEVWMRLSIADLPAAARAAGGGPPGGYDLGETEDYRLLLFPALQLTADPPGVHPPGQQIVYHIGYNPGGNVVGAGAIFSDVLPLGIDYVASVPPGTYDPASRTITWTANLVPGQPGNLDLIVQVSGAPGQVITNTAYLLWADTLWVRVPYAFQVVCSPNDPQAEFTWTVPACAGSAVSFTNLSTGTLPISYTWDLDGDGDPDSAAEDPFWTYSAPGLYTVTLTATNACSQSVASHPLTVLQPLQDVAIAGPASLLVDQAGTYTATLLPPDAPNPQYAWNNGATTVTTTYSWNTPGQYTVAVTASNDCGQVTKARQVLVSGECISLTAVTVAGPASLLVGEEGTYLASPQPPTATAPTYLWSSGDVGDSAVYSWAVPGTYTVTVTASNCQGVVVSGTLPVLVTSECVSLTAVTIAGPAVLLPGEEGQYSASPSPPTATNPAYLWDSGQVDPSVAYSWAQPGTYTVTVTATNCLGAVVARDDHAVQVYQGYSIYLPLVVRGP